MAELPEQLLAEVRDEIGRADSKASILLAGITALTGILVASWLQGQWTGFTLPRSIFLAASVLALLFAGAALTAAIYPRGLGPGERAPRVYRYFGDAAGWDPRGLAEHLSGLTDADVRERTCSQILASSRIVRRKYALIRAAIWGLAAAAGFCLLAVVF